MGYQLRRALREALPQEINGLQRAVALEIADDARDETRLSYAQLEDLRRWTAAKDTNVIRNALKRLAVSGWEFRVPIGKGKDGRIIYAKPGVRLTFRVPDLEGVAVATPSDEGGAEATPEENKGEPTLPLGVATAPSQGATAPSEGAPAPPFSSVPQTSALPSFASSEQPQPEEEAPPAPVVLDGELVDDTEAPAPVTAQTIVSEWLDRCTRRPPTSVIGQVAKHIKNLLADNIHPDDIRRGTARWMDKGLHPNTLPSVVNGVMNGTAKGPNAPQRPANALFDPSTGTDLFDRAMARAKARDEARERGEQPPAL